MKIESSTVVKLSPSDVVEIVKEHLKRVYGYDTKRVEFDVQIKTTYDHPQSPPLDMPVLKGVFCEVSRNGKGGV